MKLLSKHLKLLNQGPTHLLPWLLNQNSMTDKLKQATDLPVSLHVLSQKWVPVGWWEKNVLKMKTGTLLQREITIEASDTPCWYARTLIPKDTYQNYEPLFSRLREESLGDIIFSDKRISRTSLNHYQIDAHCMEYYWLSPAIRMLYSQSQDQNQNHQFWVRLSEFHIEEQSSFYLTEILLPGLQSVTSIGGEIR